ncbi:anti-sigma factor [Terriglobus roseus]|uniref:Regulator of SigK n=1 Tax=Terriglobus roseus TaxID=392734 RepID=A0A1G7G2T2_9BACT|nr:anti-sigma factor [Terriglobus roseus]SDE82451.1 Anti-sigma-K factor RskA [Terriglobus roseus]
MNEHLQFDEDLELYALGVLDADERDAFETHLATCSICKERLAQAQQRVGFWGTNVEQMQPSAHVKQSLMERVRLESSHRVVSQHSSERRSFWSFFSQPMLAWGCAAVVAVVAVILASQTQTLKNRLNSLQAEMQTQEDAAAKDRRVAELLTSPQTQRVALKQPTDAARPEGRVYYQPQQGLLFYAANLPAAPADHVYQLWLVPAEGAPISAGIFQANEKGEASVLLPTLPAGAVAKAFAVTVEPAGGVPQPTGPKVLVGLV